MSLTITDRLMQSPDTRHTAAYNGSGWTVTWLPGRVLTRNQAVTAMTIAQAVGRIPADAGPEAYSDKLWLHLDNWAAELGLSGPQAVARASEALAAVPTLRATLSDSGPPDHPGRADSEFHGYTPGAGWDRQGYA